MALNNYYDMIYQYRHIGFHGEGLERGRAKRHVTAPLCGFIQKLARHRVYFVLGIVVKEIRVVESCLTTPLEMNRPWHRMTLVSLHSGSGYY